jgi:hypothetical protein
MAILRYLRFQCSTDYCAKTASKQNPKFEARNPKQTDGQINPKSEKIQNAKSESSLFGILVIEFVSYFGFRVSNLRLLPILRVLRASAVNPS